MITALVLASVTALSIVITGVALATVKFLDDVLFSLYL
jgi:hypothetical protein